MSRRLPRYIIISMQEFSFEMRDALTTLERSARVGIWTYDVAADQVRWSDGIYRIFGRQQEKYAPTLRDVLEHCAPVSRRLLMRTGIKALVQATSFALDVELVRTDGEHLWARIVGDPQTIDGKVVRVVGCCMDIEASQSAEKHNRMLQEQVRYHRDYDPLTNLPNRGCLERELTLRLGVARARGAGGWLLHLDLDRFKLANEACGPAAGDRLIREIATLLLGNLESPDFLARLGGDQFAAIIAAIEPSVAIRKATSLVELIDQYRFHAGARNFRLSVSIGAAPIDVSAQHSGELFRRAETSCRLAKQQGGARVVVYRRGDAELASSETDLSWGEEILGALDQGRFELYAQRVMDLTDSGPPAYEILLRLRTSDGSIASPDRFLPAARRYGLMNAIDRHVVQLVLRHFADTPALQKNCEYVAINLSGASLCDDSFISFLLPALARVGVDPRKLCFEITESEALYDFAAAQEMVGRLHASGYRVFLDDFGNGFTSFHYLRNFEVVGLKLDESYIRHLDHQPFNQAIVSSIAQICESLGLELVAEGLESIGELEVLKQFGIRRAQGFLFHRPEPLLKAIAPH